MKLNLTKYFLGALFLFAFQLLSAQVSGYMGKRLILKFDTYTIPYFPIENTRNYPINHFPVRKNIGVEYVVGRNSLIGLSYAFNSTQFHYSDDFGKLNNNGLSFSFSSYQSKHGIAPIGKFYQFRLNYFKSEYSIRVNDYYGMRQTKKTGETQNFILGIVVGNSGVLFDRLLYSYGLQFGYRLGTLISVILEPDEAVEYSVNRRNLFNEFWGIHFGLGLLL